MTDLRKRFRKKPWFPPGEELLAACLVQPKGTAWRSVTMGPLGAVSQQPPGGGAAGRMPDGQLILALTNRRLVTFRHGNTRPKQELVSWDLGEVAAVQLEKRTVIHHLQLAFADGSAVDLDAGRAGEPERLVEAFAAR